MRYTDGDVLPDCDTAFDEGFEDAFNGRTDADNPYPIGTDQHMSWNDGWMRFHDDQDRTARSSLKAESEKIPDLMLDVLRTLSMDDIAARLDVPLSDWPGKCFELADGLVRAFDWKGATAVYGHYLGSVSPACSMFHGKPLIRHGWIVTAQGCIVDPTRWVFESVAPYLKVLEPWDDEMGEIEHYDEGGEVFNGHLLGEPPSFQAGAVVIDVPDTGELAFLPAFLFQRLGAGPGELGLRRKASLEELRWIAKIPYTRIREASGPLYRWLETEGLGAAIPVDYRLRAVREGQLPPALTVSPEPA